MTEVQSVQGGPTDLPPIRIGMCLGQFVYPQTMASVYRLAGMGPLDFVQTSFIDVGRELMATRFVDECDEPYLLFVDADHTFRREDAEMLVQALEWYPKLGVCAGLTVYRDSSFKPVVQWFENDAKLPGKKLLARTQRYMREKAVKEVDYVGTGFTLIRREVFADLERPYFRIHHDHKKNFWGEDVFFMLSVKDAGWKVGVHFGTNIGHIGSTNYEPRELLNLEV
jgi:GT2 family glycosyltransferase